MEFDGKLKDFLNLKVEEYNQPFFIEHDPISIPHQFTRKQDIEISGFWAAILAWGQRKTIVNKCNELLGMMDNVPFEFIMNHSENDLKTLQHFKHRTFNGTDTLYFIKFFRDFYSKHESLEEAFVQKNVPPDKAIEKALIDFQRQFFNTTDYPERTKKHIATPERKSACKRLNMFLRWMVRKDDRGVDFGIWHQINSSTLISPCDVHVDRVGRRLGLISRKQIDWMTAIELTENLKKFDPTDPVKYDFALFGLGVMEGYK
ncbi:MAG: TIGR02757 family protein [Bacteroidetes bacterium]|nr:TIGR02757 family protein [Bacteroidota bacterium]MDA1119092.1 TIGR02757 family protein [Bacteroidota bacterium]